MPTTDRPLRHPGGSVGHRTDVPNRGPFQLEIVICRSRIGEMCTMCYSGYASQAARQSCRSRGYDRDHGLESLHYAAPCV